MGVKGPRRGEAQFRGREVFLVWFCWVSAIGFCFLDVFCLVAVNLVKPKQEFFGKPTARLILNQ